MTDKVIKKRSLAQNRYRWGVVVGTVLKYINEELAREGSSYRASKDDVDFHIKSKALKIAHIIPTSLGDFIVRGEIRGTSTVDFSELMQQIQAYFAKRGIIIADPQEDIRDIEEQYKNNLERL